METKIYSDAKLASFNTIKASITDDVWTNIENSITNGTAKLGVLCIQYNVPADIFRSWLIEKFGDRVEFRRGPKGGIRFKKD